MGAAYFYQLSERPLDLALPQLLEKALGAGWRIEVRAALPADLSYLDEMLWAKPEDGFLPHTLAGTQGEDATPIVSSEHPWPDRVCLMTVVGAEIDAKEITSRTRTCVIFDGQKQEELQKAALCGSRSLKTTAKRNIGQRTEAVGLKRQRRRLFPNVSKSCDLFQFGSIRSDQDRPFPRERLTFALHLLRREYLCLCKAQVPQILGAPPRASRCHLPCLRCPNIPTAWYQTQFFLRRFGLGQYLMRPCRRENQQLRHLLSGLSDNARRAAVGL